MSYKDLIIGKVNASTGIKSVDLALAVMDLVNPVKFNHEEYSNALSDAVERSEIVEMEFILPQIDYRTKSIYFPRGTKFGVLNASDYIQ
jgi:hypothetical protein